MSVSEWMGVDGLFLVLGLPWERIFSSLASAADVVRPSMPAPLTLGTLDAPPSAAALARVGEIK